ncbi:hypothetical protein D9M69_665180 [compost metagenome]
MWAPGVDRNSGSIDVADYLRLQVRSCQVCGVNASLDNSRHLDISRPDAEILEGFHQVYPSDFRKPSRYARNLVCLDLNVELARIWKPEPQLRSPVGQSQHLLRRQTRSTRLEDGI